MDSNNYGKIDQATIETFYDEWCDRIAEARDTEEFINHFREHVWQHFDRHNRKGKISLDVWLVSVFNFMNILRKKFPYITTADMLFKLCSYHKNNEGGVEPPFNIDEFMKWYDGDIKKLHKI